MCDTVTTMSSRRMKSSSSTSGSSSVNCVRRGVANLSRTALSPVFTIVWMRAHDIELVGNLDGQLVELFLDLVAADRGQALQAKVKDGPGLLGGQLVRALVANAMAR